MASNIVQLLDEKIKIENWLNNVLYGSIETRVRKSKKYIYVHYRDGKKIITKYAGEYSARLINIITENTLLAKENKKRLKKIIKQLKELNYTEKNLSSSIKESVRFINNSLITIIQNQLRFDDLEVAYDDIKLLIEDGVINNLIIEVANKINNLKNAWNFVLNKDVLNAGLSYSLLSQINSLIDAGFSYNAGRLRRTPYQIENSTYIPSIPFENVINDNFKDIIKCKDATLDKALNILIYLSRNIVFTNSNLQTNLIFVNYYLIKNGLGFINIDYNFKDELNKCLLELYEWNDSYSLKEFIKNKCYYAK